MQEMEKIKFQKLILMEIKLFLNNLEKMILKVTIKSNMVLDFGIGF